MAVLMFTSAQNSFSFYLIWSLYLCWF